MNDQLCGNCNFYVEGECRRFPPQVVVVGNYVNRDDQKKTERDSEWPWVSENGWCGEWAPSSPETNR